MPRNTQPFDAVQRYFRTAPMDAVDLAVQVVRGIVKERKERVEAILPKAATPALGRKPRRKRAVPVAGAPKAEKPREVVPQPVLAGQG